MLKLMDKSQQEDTWQSRQGLFLQDHELFILVALSDKSEKGTSKSIRHLNKLLISKSIEGVGLTRKLLRLELLLHNRLGDESYCRSRLKSYQRRFAQHLIYNEEEDLELDLFRNKIGHQSEANFLPGSLHQLYFGFTLLS
jgi:hypothetical protein